MVNKGFSFSFVLCVTLVVVDALTLLLVKSISLTALSVKSSEFLECRGGFVGGRVFCVLVFVLFTKEPELIRLRVCHPSYVHGPSKFDGSDYVKRNLRSPRSTARLQCPCEDP